MCIRDRGQEAAFSAERVYAAEAAPANAEAWTRGVLVADGMRVGDFVAELARYRRGWLRCDTAVSYTHLPDAWEWGGLTLDGLELA